jgi:hypothetical protein
MLFPTPNFLENDSIFGGRVFFVIFGGDCANPAKSSARSSGGFLDPGKPNPCPRRQLESAKIGDV